MTQRTGGQGRGVGGMSGRAAAWLAWSLVTLSVVLLVGWIALAQIARSTAPGRPFYNPVEAVFVLATVLTFSVVGAIVASRQPRNAIGWIFCGIGLVVSLNSFTGSYAGYRLAGGSAPGSLAETAAWFSSWSWTLWIYVPTTFLLLLFPDGVDSPILDAVAIAGAIPAGASMLASAVSLIVRMRRAGRVERQQIKWLAYGGAVVVGAVFVGGVISVWIEEVGISLIIIGLLGLPIFTGIAILRSRLYDIDIVINRTLVYATLTATLALLYFGGVTALQRLLSPVMGEGNGLAVVASTLLIAALFNPLRRRIQAFIDRRFYRSKYDARKTLESFSARLRDETDLEALRGDLEGVVRETMQPAHVSLWLRPETSSKVEKAD